MNEVSDATRVVDIIIITAITLEYQAVLQVNAGAWPGSTWEQKFGPNGLPVAIRAFRARDSQRLRVAVTQAGDMGAVAATNALLPLVRAYRPTCVAMCGVCAGRPGKTALGDVIAAERLFFHDTGKQLPDAVQQDIKTYNLRDDWRVAVEHFDFAATFHDEAWWRARPIPYEWQENWVLTKLRDGVADPVAHPEFAAFCPQWEKVIETLWKAGHIEPGTLTLTDDGRKRIGPILIRHRNRLPDLSPTGTLLPFKVHVAPIGSGNRVVEDEHVWSFISDHVRKALGLEMEAAALGALVHAQRDLKLDMLVMKAVMDFANHGRDDHFKEFSARAAAECLLAFLRANVTPEVIPGDDDLLVPGTATSPADPPPSALLDARYEAVPFCTRGREAILTELDRWCDEGPDVATRLLHAEGGIGKTRLAIEWTRQRRARGWCAGFLPKDVPAAWFERLWTRGQPVLVVLDYAESRPDLLDVLQRVLRYHQQVGTGSLRRVRMLLLARNAGDWWKSLQQRDPALGAWLGTTPPRELTPLAVHPGEREAAFREAADVFAVVRWKNSVVCVPGTLDDKRFERVLYLHMAALAAVEGLPFDANTLMDVILGHEEHFWESRTREGDAAVALQRAVARQVVASATLRGGFGSASAALAVIERMRGRAPSEADEALLRVLHRVYHNGSAGASTYLPALEPDLLGEGMVLRVAAPVLAEDQPTDDWIDRVFAPDDEERTVRTGLEVLGRASATKPDVMRPWIGRMLSGPLQPRAVLALAAAKAVGQRTALSALGDVLTEHLEARGDVDVAQSLEAVGIPYPTVSLRRVAEWTGRVQLERIASLEDEQAQAERATLLIRQGLRLLDLDRRDEALEATRECVTLRRALAQRNPEAFQFRLAESLNNLGIMLNAVGRRSEALQAAHEAVAQYRAIAQRSPHELLPNLAESLNNLGILLLALGRRDEALQATHEAVAQFRAIEERAPGAFRPAFASCLNNLAVRLNAVGCHEDALTAAHEAVAQHRALVLMSPDAFVPGLAASLSSLSITLHAVGQHDQALDAALEVVAQHRELARRHPDAFLPDLAGLLNNLGVFLHTLDRHDEALEATREAVTIRRELAQQHPDVFLPRLAESLVNLGSDLSELGRHEAALEVTHEGVRHCRSLAQHNPDAFLPDLAGSLHNLGMVLYTLGRPDEALEVARETVTLHRGLAKRHPDTFLPKLAYGLNNLSNRLIVLGRLGEALVAVEEALDILWPYFERLPVAFASNTAVMLRQSVALHGFLQQPPPPTLVERIATFNHFSPS